MPTRAAGRPKTREDAIYRKWQKIKGKAHDPAWDRYPVFHKWCQDSGYMTGMMLVRKCKSQPYGPENCTWAKDSRIPEDDSERAETIRKWNKTVNRFRRAAGMIPFPED